MDLIHFPAEQGRSHGSRFVHPLRPLDVDLDVLAAEVGVQLVDLGLQNSQNHNQDFSGSLRIVRIFKDHFFRNLNIIVGFNLLKISHSGPPVNSSGIFQDR